MGGFASWDGLLEVISGIAETGLQWLVQSTLVLAAGLAAAWLLRSRGAALQSAVYRTTLVATLACPIVAYLLSLAGWNFVAVHLPELRVATEELVLAPAPVEPPVPASVGPEAKQPAPPPSQVQFNPSPEASRPFSQPPLLASDGQNGPADAAPIELPPAQGAIEVPADPPAVEPIYTLRTVMKTRTAWAVAVSLAAATWLLASFVLLLRLIVQHAQLRHLRRSAASVDDEDRRLCNELAARMQLVPPALLRSPYVSSPCLAGVMRPTILLPEEVPAELPAVLVHELAHLARGDGWWNLLRHVAVSLLCPQPLVWQLSRRLEAAAEEVCDDHVVQFGTDRLAYAETLVSLAERTLLPASGAVVSLVTLRSLLARRITRILDRSQRLSLSVGLAALCLIAAIGVSAALVAGLFGPGARTQAAAADEDAGRVVQDDVDGADNAPALPADGEKDAKHISGTVHDTDGKAAVGAHVVLIGRKRLAHPAGYFMAPGEMTVLAQTRASSDGRFSLDVEGLSSPAFQRVQLLVRSEASALAWRDVNLDAPSRHLDIALAAPRETRGRLVTLEGQPAAGVHVVVDKIGQETPGDFKAAESMRAELPREVWPMDVTTDADGWFSVPGVAADMDVMLWVQQEPYATHWWQWKADDRSSHVQPLTPAQPIEGTVVAADTGDALRGVRLTAYQGWDPARRGMMGIDGGADENGHFRLNPFPAKSFDVTAFGPEGTPYLPRKVSFEWPETKREHSLRIELARGVLVRGTLVEEPGGKPVSQARIEYQAGPGNKFITDETVTDWQAPVVSDDQGRFAMAVPPGPGFVTVQSNDLAYVAREVGSNTLREGKPGGERWYVHGYARFDLDEDAREHPLEIQLALGATMEAEVVLSDGTPPERLLVYHRGMLSPVMNTHTHHAPQTVQGGHVSIKGVPIDDKLSVYLLDPKRKQGRVLSINAQDAAQTRRIELEKCGSATVRFVDPQGKAVPGANPSFDIVFAPGKSRYLRDRGNDLLGDDEILANFDRLNHWDLSAGADGTITYEALIPGVEYRLLGVDDKGKLMVDRTIRVESGERQQLPDYLMHDADSLRNAEENWLKRQKAAAADDQKKSVAAPSSPASSTDGSAVRSSQPAAVGNSSAITPTGDDDLVVVRGRVLDPDGKSAAAKLTAVRFYWDYPGERLPLATAAAGPDGRFEIAFRKSQYDRNLGRPQQWRETTIVATAPGYGLAWTDYTKFVERGQPTLNLVPDEPIEGRIVDLEGRPVVGATVALKYLTGDEKNDLTAWLAALRKGVPFFGSQDYGRPGDMVAMDSKGLATSVRTDRDGRFRLVGMGRQRVVALRLSAPGIVTAELHVVTSPMEPLAVDFGESNGKWVTTYYGSKFQYAAEPSQSIVGTVRDAKTGRPLAGVRVGSHMFAGTRISGVHTIETISDQQGKYRLDGMPKGSGNQIIAIPNDDQAYFMREIDVPTASGFEAITCDVELHRGIWIHGRLFDTTTDKPVYGHMFYLPWPDNPNIEGLKEFNSFHLPGLQMRYETDAQGRFKLVALPGRGLLAARTIDFTGPGGQGVRAITDLPDNERFRRVAGVFAPTAVFPTAVREIRPGDEDQEVTADIGLDPGQRVKLRIVDSQGRGLAGVWVEGLWPKARSHRDQNAGSEVDVVGLVPDEKRLVFLHHKARNLGRATYVNLADVTNGSLTMTLEPCATVTARLLDQDGEPAKGAQIDFGPVEETDFGLHLPRIATDMDGRFTNAAVLPGIAYSIGIRSGELGVRGIAENLTVAPGETIDLGEFDVTAKARPEPKRTPAAAARDAKPDAAKPGADDRVTLHGMVLSPDGKPIAGAIVRTKQLRPDADDFERAPPRTVQADAQRRFEIALDLTREQLAEWPEKWPLGIVAAFAPGFGPAWSLRFAGDVNQEITLRLVEDQVIEGRLVGLEGQPLAGVHARVTSIETNEREDLTDWFDALRRGTPRLEAASLAEPKRRLGIYTAAALPEHDPIQIEAVSDADGRLRLEGIGRGRLAYVKLWGPGIATSRQWFVAAPMAPLNVLSTDNGIPQQQTYYGTPFQFVAATSQVIEGTVRDAITRQPLAGAWIISDMLAGTRISANHLVRTRSDAEGHYRLDGMPQGAGNRIAAVADGDEPYFGRQFDVPSSDSFAPVKLDLDLRRGVWIRGQVTQRASGRAARGQVFYLPWPDNAAAEGIRRFSPEVLRNDDFPERQMVDADGRYRVVGLPGRGLVGFRNLDLHRPVPAGQGVNEIADLPPEDAFRKFSGMLTPRAAFVTAIKAVDVRDEATAVADFALDEGEKITLNVVDPAGQPLAGLTATGLWPVGAYYDREKLGPTLEIAALAPGEERTIVIEHTDRKLGKRLHVSRKEHGPGPVAITLEPCATVSGRLTDHDGEPLVGARVTFYFFTGPNYLDRTKDLVTDADGRFTNANVAAGGKYQVSCGSRLGTKSVTNSLTVSAGETVDLGDIDLTIADRPEPKRTPAVASKPKKVTGTFVPSPQAGIEAAKPNKIEPDREQRFTFTGKVLDPAGKPVGSAKLFLLYYTPARVGALPLGATKADGSFEAQAATSDFDTGESSEPWNGATLAATADGFGMAWTLVAPFETTGALVKSLRAKPGFSEKLAAFATDRTIRLTADDAPIEGRILSLEGQGIAGAKIRVLEIHSHRQNNLDGWLAAVASKKADYYTTRKLLDHGLHGLNIQEQVLQLFAGITTGADGRFTIRGIGRERIVKLQIEGPAIETRQVFARTRPGRALVIPNQIGSPLNDLTYYGASFDHAAAPSRAVRGVVRDKDTAQPIPGVTIQADALAGERLHGWTNAYIHTTSDAEGRYELVGLPMGDNELVAAPPKTEPYLASSKKVDTSPGRDAATLDFEIKRGIWIRGRITDSASGKPLRGRVEYFAFRDNPHLKTAPPLVGSYSMPAQFVTDTDGRYAIPGLPGPGLVSLMVNNHEDYSRGAGVEKITRGRDDHEPRMFKTNPYSFVEANCHAAVEIDPADDADQVDVDFALVAGKLLAGTVMDAEGQPLAGAMFFGMGEASGWQELPEATFKVHNVQAGKPRRLQFHHNGRRLAGTLHLTGDESEPFSVRLVPWGAVTGRVLDKNGEPAADVTLNNSFRAAEGEQRNILPQLATKADAEGRFKIEGLSPGASYGISATDGNRYLGEVIDNFQVASGETKDLGDLTIITEEMKKDAPAKVAPKPAVPKEPAAPKPNAANDRLEFSGQVVDAAGNPAAGAKIYLLQESLDVTEPKLVGQSNADGSFQISLAKSDFHADESSEPWLTAKLLATSDGRGLAWALAASFDPSGKMAAHIPPYPNLSMDRRVELVDDRTLRLAADDVPIEGRIVDLEGNPVAGARVRVLYIQGTRQGTLDAWIETIESKDAFNEIWTRLEHSTGFNNQRQLEQLFAGIKTGADGRFRIRGIGRERVVKLQIEGPDIETRQIYARTRSGATLQFVDPRWPDLQPELYHGARFDFVVGPSRPVRGVVRDVDTKKPLAGVRVQAYRLANVGVQPYPNAVFYTLTDAEGRYELGGLPVASAVATGATDEENKLLAIAAESEPYLASARPAEIDLSTKETIVDFELKRGVWISGRVTDAASGKPLRATVEYDAFRDNLPHEQAPGYTDTFPLPHSTDRDGQYRIPGFAGRGLVTVRAANYSDYPKGAGADAIEGGKRWYETIEFDMAIHHLMASNYHALAAVNPTEDGAGAECNFALVPGPVIAGTVQDPDGKPLAGARIRGAVEGGVWQPLSDATFSIRNLQSGKPRRVQFYHAQRRLAGTVLLKGDEQGPLAIKLEPWAALTGRVIDADGDAMQGVRVSSGKSSQEWGVLPLHYDFAVDSEGRFKIEGLAPGAPYALAANRAVRGLGTLVENVQLTAGETKDLGDLKVMPSKPRMPEKAMPAKKTAAASAAAPTGDDAKQQVALADASGRLEFAGRVVNPAGKPVHGAKLYLPYYSPKDVETKPWAETAPDGSFEFTVNKDNYDGFGVMDEPWQTPNLVAAAPNYGLAWASAVSFEKSGAILKRLRAKPNFIERSATLAQDNILRLVADDVPIEGRILNLEGQAIAGASVQVIGLESNRENNLDVWLKAVEKEKADFYQARTHVPNMLHGNSPSRHASPLFRKATSGADGSFKIEGLGRERIVQLQIEGPGIETRQFYARTRPGHALHVIGERRDPELSKVTFYGSQFNVAAAPSRPVTGLVRDVDTDKPLAGITIQAYRLAGERISGWSNAYIHTTTDAEGRYRLEGLPLGNNEVAAAASKEEPYLPAVLKVETDPTQPSATCDFELKRGVWIRGRVSDAAKGTPLRGRVEYFAFVSNPNVKLAPGLLRANLGFHTTDSDGRFTVAAIPGRGLIAFSANQHEAYPRGVGAEDIKGDRADKQGMIFETHPYYALVSNFHRLVEVNPTADADLECDIVARAGPVIEGTVLDPAGKPLSGTMFAGGHEFMYFSPLEKPTFTIHNLKPGESRRIQFFHNDQKLAGSLLVTGDETGPLSVKLEPWGAVIGRVLLADGTPADAVILRSANKKNAADRCVLPSNSIATDSEGRFRIEGIAAGVDYSLAADKAEQSLGTVIEQFQVSAGETKDLGDLTIKQSKK
jgi:beta-lactamase regulating signal transducer with metallopeptidase domain